MLKAVIYKEWLKTRNVFLLGLLLALCMTGYDILNMNRVSTMHGVEHIWQIMLMKDNVFCQSFMLFAFDCRNRHRTVANDSGNVEEKVEIDLAFALSSTENDIYDAYGRIHRIAFRFTDHDRLHCNLRLFDFSTRISA